MPCVMVVVRLWCGRCVVWSRVLPYAAGVLWSWNVVWQWSWRGGRGVGLHSCVAVLSLRCQWRVVRAAVVAFASSVS